MASTGEFRIAMVTTLMPETHYSRYLIEALLDKLQEKVSLRIYSNREDEVTGLEKADINRCWLQNFLYPVQIAKQAVKDKVRIVHLQHEFNMYGGRATAILFPILILLLKLSRRKVIVTIHAVVPRSEIDSNFLEMFSKMKNKLMVIMLKIVLFYVYTITSWLSDFIIVHSNHLRSILASDYKANAEKILVIPHGVPARDTSARAQEINTAWWRRVKDKRIILYFGYVVKRKGLEYLIHAFERASKKHLDYVLVIAGGSLRGHEDYVATLTRLVAEKELSDKIVFTSFVTEMELQELLLLSKFVVLPALYSISASGPLAQAIAFHKPVITVDLGTFREEVVDGVEGLLYPPWDAQSLEDAMLKLMQNRDLLNKMSENMKAKAEERSWANIALRTSRVYATLMQFC